MGPPETEEAGGVQAQQQHLSMKAVGTVGYMDPEYYGLHHLTVKSDVYGFSVVMLETLTGKPAIFKEAEGGSPVSVVDYAQPSIVAGELGKVLDGRAPEPSPHEAVKLVAGLHGRALRAARGQGPAGDGQHRGQPGDGVRALRGQRGRQPRRHHRGRLRQQLVQRQPLHDVHGAVGKAHGVAKSVREFKSRRFKL
ncbi:hypothetical protein VPH35_098190 [Triticum aestivum]